MGKTETKPKIRYVRCLGGAATVIGLLHIQPASAPIEVDDETYRQFKEHFDFYEEKGVIAVDVPGSKAFRVSQRAASAHMRLAQETFSDGVVPPGPIVMPMMPGGMRDAAARNRQRAAAMEGNTIDPEYCRARKVDGNQCGMKPRKDSEYCIFHSKRVTDGQDVYDMEGFLVTLEDLGL